jgi:hypothetical protein
MKSESELTRPLLKALETAMLGSVVTKHSDRFTFGIPDISIDWINTAWLEVKATEGEKIEHHKNWGRQLIDCRRRERATHRCWFVVYRQILGVKSIVIIRPREVFEDRRLGLADLEIPGHDHGAVAAFVRRQLEVK